MRPEGTKCPHPDIRFCPLYVAAHQAGGFGCDDGKLGDFTGCAVDRRLNYDQAVARLAKANPELVKERAAAESAWMAREQHRRNMRGIH